MEKSQNNLTSILWSFLMLPLGIPLLIQLYKLSTKKTRKDKLIGKVVFITGASSGLGEALARIFYLYGCKVILAARRTQELERVKNSLTLLESSVTTFTPHVIKLDLEDEYSLKSAVEEIYRIYGVIDILINNGGVGNRGSVINTSIEVDKKVMMVNYLGPVALTKLILPQMVKDKNGHIVFVSSVQGLIAIPHRSSYAASKHALQAFADSLRAEVFEDNIKISIISPGYINTSLSLNALTPTGAKYGITDHSTATGYDAQFVADKILDMVINDEKELVLSPLAPKFAIYLRQLLPSLYFKIMARRARHT